MPRSLATALLAVLSVTLLLAAPGRTAAADPPPVWLPELMARLAAIPERHATFQEEKHIAALDAPLLSQGRLVYRRPAHLEKITTAPDPETLVVDADRLTLAASDAAPLTVRLGRRPEIAALVDAVRGALAGDLTVLQSHYHLRAEGSPAAWQLTLQPIDPAVQRLLRSVTVEGNDINIRAFRTTQTNGDEATMTIVASP